jgi:hypothetical protein
MIFLKGEPVPAWLARGPDVTFGCDVCIEVKGDSYVVRPRQKMAADECLVRATDVPHFPKPTILWHEPKGDIPPVDIYSAAQSEGESK